jgi:hypothetical protein
MRTVDGSVNGAPASPQPERSSVHLSPEQLDILCAAWAAGRDGRGVVITNDAYPAAHRLAEVGWLQRRFQGRYGEIVALDAGR